MDYPQAFELLIYSTAASSLLAMILPSMRKVVKGEFVIYDAIGPTKIRMKKAGTITIYAAKILAIVWVLSTFYILLGPMMSPLESFFIYLNIVLWTVTAVGSVLGALSIFYWVDYL